MTKRVLSLLLALVMALSLCVPAFAAEAPVDEAEEVGAEVVDAPAEVAVDEPAEVAADEPAAIDYVNEGVLQAVVNQANGIKAGVVAGEYQVSGKLADWPAGFGSTYTKDNAGAALYFMAKLEDAEDVLKEIADTEGGYHVWHADSANAKRFQDAYDQLTLALNLVTAYIRHDTGKDQMGEMNNWLEWYQDILDENKSTSYGSGDYDVQPWFETEVKEAMAFLKGLPGYDADAEKFTTPSALYKDYLAGAATRTKLGGEFEGAKNPEYTDYIELRDAIDIARTRLAGDEYFDLGNYPDSTKKVPTGQESIAEAMTEMLKRATGAGKTGFDGTVDLKEVHAWLDEIADYVVSNKHTLKIDFFYTSTDFKEAIVKVEECSDWEIDKRNYHVEISAEKTVTSAPFSAWDLANNPPSYEGNVSAKASALGVDDGDGKIKNGVTITAKLICDTGHEVVDEKTIVVDHNYNGPKITSATYTPDAITVKLSKSMHDSNGNTPSGAYDNNQYKRATLTLSYNGTVVETQELKEWDTTYKFNLKPVKLGDYSVELKVTEGIPSGGTEQTLSRSIETVTVPDITTYVGKAGTDETWKLDGATGYDNLQLAISSASKTGNLLAKNGDTTKLLKQLADNVAEAQKIVDAAATTPLSIANKAKVDAAIKALYAILKNFEKAADDTALTDAIAAGEALVASDYNNVAAWKALQDAIANGKNVKLPLADTEENQEIIADNAAAILAAIAELNSKYLIVPETELKALKDLIDSVPNRLAADDYSAESKAAVNAAVAAAQPLLTAKGVKKSEVNAAIEALQNALNNLTTVKSDAIPACPVGNGWAQAENGDYYYYDKNGKLVVNDWVPSKGLWYHMGATGKMDTGFLFIEDKWGGGYYYLNPSNTKGTMGRMFTGWKLIDGHWAWFETRSNGHQGQCTYTDYWGDFVNYRPVQK